MKFGLLSDIHEDSQQLGKALKTLEKMGCNQLICLGDIVGYSVYHLAFFDTPDANACIQAVRQNCSYVLAGNHDLNAARRLPKHQAGLNIPPDWYERSYVEKAKAFFGKIWLYDDEIPAEIDKKHIEFLQNLPEKFIVPCENFNILLSHYVFPDLTGITTRRIFNRYDTQEHLHFMQQEDCRFAFAGHTHFSEMLMATPQKHQFFEHGSPKTLNQPDSQPTLIFTPPVLTSERPAAVLTFDTQTCQLQSHLL